MILNEIHLPITSKLRSNQIHIDKFAIKLLFKEDNVYKIIYLFILIK